MDYDIDIEIFVSEMKSAGISCIRQQSFFYIPVVVLPEWIVCLSEKRTVKFKIIYG